MSNSLRGRGLYKISASVNWPLQSVTLDMLQHQWVMFTSRTPMEQRFLSSKQLLSPVYMRHIPPHALLRKAVAACVAMLDCLQRTLLGSVFLLIFFLFLSWYPSLKMTILSGEQQNHDMHGEPRLQHLVVELGTRTCCPSLFKLTWAESARLKVKRSK